MSDLVLTSADDGRTVTVDRGTVISVILEENPTTGYTWQFAEALPDCLVSAGDRYDRPAGAAIGGGGRRTFRFAAEAPGSCRIWLDLRRVWEIGLAPAGRFLADVVVR